MTATNWPFIVLFGLAMLFPIGGALYVIGRALLPRLRGIARREPSAGPSQAPARFTMRVRHGRLQVVPLETEPRETGRIKLVASGTPKPSGPEGDSARRR